MDSTKQMFFIALLPPEEVQQRANEIKEHFAQVYNSKAALKSPPHITLQPPFNWEESEISKLEEVLQQAGEKMRPIPIILRGFGAFPPRVIYIYVEKTPELLDCQKQLTNCLQSQLGIVDVKGGSRPFSPHLTVAYRDLTRSNFYQALPKFQQKELCYEFSVSKLTLLIHQEQRWHIFREFDLTNEDL